MKKKRKNIKLRRNQINLVSPQIAQLLSVVHHRIDSSKRVTILYYTPNQTLAPPNLHPPDLHTVRPHDPTPLPIARRHPHPSLREISPFAPLPTSPSPLFPTLQATGGALSAAATGSPLVPLPFGPPWVRAHGGKGSTQGSTTLVRRRTRSLAHKEIN
jgi:hypothetical protein